MKLQTIITATAMAALVTPVSVIAQSEDNFHGYPYCNGCESNYSDSDGEWYYDDSWCKVNEALCKIPTCEPVDGYSCCENSSAEVFDIDVSGTWGIENSEWCLIKSLQPFTDVDISVRSYLDLMPKYNTNGQKIEQKEAYFIFTLEGINTYNFFEKYEFETIIINGNKISIDKVKYNDQSEDFRINTEYYIEGSNSSKFVIKNKTTNISYTKEISSNLYKAY